MTVLIEREAINFLSCKFNAVQGYGGGRGEAGGWLRIWDRAGPVTTGLRRKSVSLENIICQWANTRASYVPYSNSFSAMEFPTVSNYTIFNVSPRARVSVCIKLDPSALNSLRALHFLYPYTRGRTVCGSGSLKERISASYRRDRVRARHDTVSRYNFSPGERDFIFSVNYIRTLNELKLNILTRNIFVCYGILIGNF